MEDIYEEMMVVSLEISASFSLLAEQEEFIVQAITNHEAFVEPKRIDSLVGQMISDAL